jgi:hypothetical protein
MHDPRADVQEARQEYGIKPVSRFGRTRYDAGGARRWSPAVQGPGYPLIRKPLKPRSVIYDIKHLSTGPGRWTTPGGVKNMKVLVTGAAGFMDRTLRISACARRRSCRI